MFSKTASTPAQTQAQPQPQPSALQTVTPAAPAAPAESARPQPRGAKTAGASIIGPDMVLEGDISGGGEIQIDGTVKGDIRVEHVTIGDGGQVEGGVYAEAVEVRGSVTGSITAKQVRLYGACHVDGDITHEQLAMETGAFFQGRSLRLQRPAAATRPEPLREASVSARVAAS